MFSINSFTRKNTIQRHGILWKPNKTSHKVLFFPSLLPYDSPQSFEVPQASPVEKMDQVTIKLRHFFLMFFLFLDSLDSTAATIFRRKKKGDERSYFQQQCQEQNIYIFLNKPNQSALKRNGHSPLPEVAWKIDFLPLDFEPGVFQHRWDSK